MEIIAELSPKIVKKGDIFEIMVTITNNTDKAVKLSSIDVEIPPAFVSVEEEVASGIRKGWRENLRKIIWDKLPPGINPSPLPWNVTDEIQPHGKYQQVFKIKAGWSPSPFRPRPETYRVPVNVKYTEGNITHNAITSLELSLFPSFGSMLSGTLVGSFLGTIVKNADKISPLGTLVSLDPGMFFEDIMSIFVIPLIFGLIAGLILTRKKDVQSFLTIEDFWGGIVVGFVVGYNGSQIVENALNLPFGETPQAGGG